MLSTSGTGEASVSLSTIVGPGEVRALRDKAHLWLIGLTIIMRRSLGFVGSARLNIGKSELGRRIKVRRGTILSMRETKQNSLL
jgi:hypothetical protein